MTRTTCSAPRAIKRYGWIPDLPDQRDFIYAAPLAVLRALSPKKDLTGECPPVYDQGELGSCTANAIGGAHEVEQRKQCSAGTRSWRLVLRSPPRAKQDRLPSFAQGYGGQTTTPTSVSLCATLRSLRRSPSLRSTSATPGAASGARRAIASCLTPT